MKNISLLVNLAHRIFPYFNELKIDECTSPLNVDESAATGSLKPDKYSLLATDQS